MSGNKGGVECKGELPSEDRLQRISTMMALSRPCRAFTQAIICSCYHVCKDIRAVVPWQSRAYNQFVIFTILNILFLTPSHVLNLYMYVQCVCVYIYRASLRVDVCGWGEHVYMLQITESMNQKVLNTVKYHNYPGNLYIYIYIPLSHHRYSTRSGSGSWSSPGLKAFTVAYAY